MVGMPDNMSVCALVRVDLWGASGLPPYPDVPAGVKGFEPEWPPAWLENLACCCVDVHHLADGALVYIGAHA